MHFRGESDNGALSYTRGGRVGRRRVRSAGREPGPAGASPAQRSTRGRRHCRHARRRCRQARPSGRTETGGRRPPRSRATERTSPTTADHPTGRRLNHSRAKGGPARNGGLTSRALRDPASPRSVDFFAPRCAARAPRPSRETLCTRYASRHHGGSHSLPMLLAREYPSVVSVAHEGRPNRSWRRTSISSCAAATSMASKNRAVD